MSPSLRTSAGTINGHVTSRQHETQIKTVPSSNSPSLSSQGCNSSYPFKEPSKYTFPQSEGNTEVPIQLCMDAPDFSWVPQMSKLILEVLVALSQNFPLEELLGEKAPRVPASTLAIKTVGPAPYPEAQPGEG